MCCKAELRPINRELAITMLQIGMFERLHPDGDKFWKRNIPEERCTVNVIVNDDVIEANISPSVGNYHDHLGKRIAGSVYFEILAKMAEKMNATVIQKANVTGCTTGGVAQLMLAHYPDMPLSYDRVCNGFREVLLEGE